MFVLVFGCVVGFVVVLRHPQPMSLHEGLCQVDANATYGLEDMSYKIKSIENQLSVHSPNWCVPCQRSKEDFFFCFRQNFSSAAMFSSILSFHPFLIILAGFTMRKE